MLRIIESVIWHLIISSILILNSWWCKSTRRLILVILHVLIITIVLLLIIPNLVLLWQIIAWILILIIHFPLAGKLVIVNLLVRAPFSILVIQIQVFHSILHHWYLHPWRYLIHMLRIIFPLSMRNLWLQAIWKTAKYLRSDHFYRAFVCLLSVILSPEFIIMLYIWLASIVRKADLLSLRWELLRILLSFPRKTLLFHLWIERLICLLNSIIIYLSCHFPVHWESLLLHAEGLFEGLFVSVVAASFNFNQAVSLIGAETLICINESSLWAILIIPRVWSTVVIDLAIIVVFANSTSHVRYLRQIFNLWTLSDLTVIPSPHLISVSF